LRAGRRQEALQVVEAGLPLQEEAVRQAGTRYPELWRRWLTLLSTRGSLQQELGDPAEAATSLARWQTVRAEFVAQFPKERESLDRLSAPIVIRQIELDILLGQLTGALGRINEFRQELQGAGGDSDGAVSQLVDLAIQELRVRAMRGEAQMAESMMNETVERVEQLRRQFPTKFELVVLECRCKMSRAGLAVRLGRSQAALAGYREVIALVRNWEGTVPPGQSLQGFEVDSHWMASQACESLGDYVGAREHLEPIITKSTGANRNNVALRLLVINLRLGDLAAARRAADRIQNDVRVSAEAFRLLSEGEKRLQGGASLEIPN
jgi:hypothetical protein